MSSVIKKNPASGRVSLSYLVVFAFILWVCFLCFGRTIVFGVVVVPGFTFSFVCVSVFTVCVFGGVVVDTLVFCVAWAEAMMERKLQRSVPKRIFFITEYLMFVLQIDGGKTPVFFR